MKVLEPLLSMWSGSSVRTEPMPTMDLAHEPTSTTALEPAFMSITRPEPTARSILESASATQPLPEPDKFLLCRFHLALWMIQSHLKSFPIRWCQISSPLTLLSSLVTSKILSLPSPLIWHSSSAPPSLPNPSGSLVPPQFCDTNPLAVPRASEHIILNRPVSPVGSTLPLLHYGPSSLKLHWAPSFLHLRLGPLLHWSASPWRSFAPPWRSLALSTPPWGSTVCLCINSPVFSQCLSVKLLRSYLP